MLPRNFIVQFHPRSVDNTPTGSDAEALDARASRYLRRRGVPRGQSLACINLFFAMALSNLSCGYKDCLILLGLMFAMFGLANVDTRGRDGTRMLGATGTEAPASSQAPFPPAPEEMEPHLRAKSLSEHRACAGTRRRPARMARPRRRLSLHHVREERIKRLEANACHLRKLRADAEEGVERVRARCARLEAGRDWSVTIAEDGGPEATRPCLPTAEIAPHPPAEEYKPCGDAKGKTKPSAKRGGHSSEGRPSGPSVACVDESTRERDPLEASGEGASSRGCCCEDEPQLASVVDVSRLPETTRQSSCTKRQRRGPDSRDEGDGSTEGAAHWRRRYEEAKEQKQSAEEGLESAVKAKEEALRSARDANLRMRRTREDNDRKTMEEGRREALGKHAVTKAEGKARSLVKERGAARSRLDQAKQKAAALAERIDQLLAELAAERSSNKDASEALKSIIDEHREEVNKVRGLQKEIDRLQRERVYEGQMEDAILARVANGRYPKELEAELNLDIDRHHALVERFAQLESAYEHLESEAEAESQAHATVQKDISELKQKHEALCLMIAERDRSISAEELRSKGQAQSLEDVKQVSVARSSEIEELEDGNELAKAMSLSLEDQLNSDEESRLRHEVEDGKVTLTKGFDEEVATRNRDERARHSKADTQHSWSSDLTTRRRQMGSPEKTLNDQDTDRGACLDDVGLALTRTSSEKEDNTAVSEGVESLGSSEVSLNFNVEAGEGSSNAGRVSENSWTENDTASQTDRLSEDSMQDAGGDVDELLSMLENPTNRGRLPVWEVRRDAVVQLIPGTTFRELHETPVSVDRR